MYIYIYIYIYIYMCVCVCVTSRGERMPQSMDIQYSRANIKGDMSNFMKTSENFM